MLALGCSAGTSAVDDDHLPVSESIYVQSPTNDVSVLLLHSTFGQQPAEVTLAMALVSMAFLMFHIFAQPYRMAWVNLLQTCSNVCLVLLCVQQLVLSAFRTATFDPTSDKDIQHFVTQVDGLAMLLCLPVPLFLAYGTFVLKEDGDGDEQSTTLPAKSEVGGGDDSPELLFVNGDNGADAKQSPSSKEHATEKQCHACGEWQPASYGFCSNCGALM